jgi:hypothetical protein
MGAIAVILAALGVWLIDSAVRNRPPWQTLKDVLSTGQLPETGKSYPVGTVNPGGIPGTPNAPVYPGTTTPGGSSSPGSSGTTPPPNQTTHPVSGTIQDWIDQATTILEQSGIPPSQIDQDAIRIIIMGESGGNPYAQNNTDRNAREGHPSQGLMQTIASTFARWSLPGHTDVWNPVDNIVAASRYILLTTHIWGHGFSQVPGVIQVRSGQRYTLGY